MNRGAVVVAVDLAEQIEWWDALDKLDFGYAPADFSSFLCMARECQHRDARWLVSLLPAGGDVTERELLVVMEDQKEQSQDPRAMFLLFLLLGSVGERAEAELRGAAEMGYAPAQGRLSQWCLDEEDDDEAFKWATLAAAQGDRYGICRLASCYESGRGCDKDEVRAIEFFKRAAELSESSSEFAYGRLAFGENDWERYVWWGRAATHGFHHKELGRSALRFLPLFQEGRHGRILHTVAPLIRSNIDIDRRLVFRCAYSEEEIRQLQRVIELHDVMVSRARAAIDCWSMAGRRRGVVKDMRVVIAKMLWEESWRWGERRNWSRARRREEAERDNCRAEDETRVLPERRFADAGDELRSSAVSSVPVAPSAAAHVICCRIRKKLVLRCRSTFHCPATRISSRRVKCDNAPSMKRGAAFDGAELIKWQDALDYIDPLEVEEGLQKVREFSTPDAVWLLLACPSRSNR
jgi:hypothetical protein